MGYELAAIDAWKILRPSLAKLFESNLPPNPTNPTKYLDIALEEGRDSSTRVTRHIL